MPKPATLEHEGDVRRRDDYLMTKFEAGRRKVRLGGESAVPSNLIENPFGSALMFGVESVVHLTNFLRADSCHTLIDNSSPAGRLGIENFPFSSLTAK